MKNLLSMLVSLSFFLPIQAGATSSATWSSWEDKDSWILGATFAGTLSFYITDRNPNEHWSSPILFDQGVRSSVRRDTPGSRNGAAVWSDILRNTLIAAPFLLDAFVLEGLRDSDKTAALRTGLISLEVFSTAIFSVTATSKLVGRARPNVADCESNSNYSGTCFGNDQHESFFSGHAMSAFTGAGLICRNHLDLHLFDSAADTVICGSSLALAGATAYLRVASDRHYATDVIAGMLVGFSAGYFLPTLWHHVEGAREQKTQATIFPIVDEDKFGLSYLVRF